MIASWLIFEACPLFVAVAYARLLMLWPGYASLPGLAIRVALASYFAVYIGTVALLMQLLPTEEGRSMSNDNAVLGVVFGLALTVLTRELLRSDEK
jgi:hypothetical protein